MPPSEPGGGGMPLEAIYQELLLDHYRRPRNRGVLEQPDATASLTNPLCGDAIELHVALDGDRVREARFRGQGCSISQASASMMTQLVRGRSLDEVRAISGRVAAMLRGDPEAAADRRLGDMRALSGVARLPARVRCAQLAWNALAQALGDR